jgi:acetyl-CoA carboxylase biotin carboxyl carrier protein
MREGPASVEILSPLVGTFYRAGQPGIPPLVAEGSHVEPDTVVGFVDVLGEPTEIEAGYAGAVTREYATDGQTVEYGQALFEVALGE